MENEYLFNRFQLCATFYYCVAKKLGFSENASKSLGLARATFFAAAKKGFKPNPKNKINTNISNTLNTNNKISYENLSMNFAGLPIFYDEQNETAFFGVKKMKHEDFDKRVVNKINYSTQNKFNILVQKIEEILNKYSKIELNSALMFEIYKEIRDKFRTTNFYNNNYTNNNNKYINWKRKITVNE